MIDEVELVKRFCPQVRPPSPEARAKARRALDQAMGPTRRLRESSRFRMPVRVFVAVLSGVCLVAVAVVFIAVPNHTTPRSRSTWEFTFRLVEPAHRLLVPASERLGVAALVRQRLNASIPGTRVSRSGDELFIRIADRPRPRLAQLLEEVEGHGPIALHVRLVAVHRH
jgi:hypothetical protein